MKKTKASPKRGHLNKRKLAAEINKEQPMTDQIYSNIAPQLLEQGFEPIPVYPGSKTPLVKWKHDKVVIDKQQTWNWSQKYPNASVGIRTQRKIVALDLDFDTGKVAEEFLRVVQDWFGITPTRTRTGSPRWLIPFRCEEVMKKGVVSYGDYMGVEFLTNTQILAYGQHPDGDLYQWEYGEFSDTPLEGLPVITHSDILKLAGELDRIVGHTRVSSTIEGMCDVNLRTPIQGQDGMPIYPADRGEVRAVAEWLLIEKGLASASRDEWLRVIQGVQSTTWPDDNCPEWLIHACRCDEYPNPEQDVDYQWRYAAGRQVENPVTFATVMHMANEMGYQEYLSSQRYATSVKAIRTCECGEKLEQEIY